MYDSYTLDQAPYGEWKATTDQTNSSHPPRSQKQPEFQRGQSRTIYLPAERTGAVIGKNGRMKHLIKVNIFDQKDTVQIIINCIGSL